MTKICKICGAESQLTQAGFSYGERPTCKCGKIRSRERMKGCPKCGQKATHTDPFMHLYLKRLRFRRKYYEMHCERCGHRWRVKP